MVVCLIKIYNETGGLVNSTVIRNMNMKWIIFLLLFAVVPATVFPAWTPRPNFSIEGSDYEGTLTFVSGMAYALTAVGVELEQRDNGGYICNAPKVIDSQLIIEILNSTVSGNVTSEQAISAVMKGLKEKYPCE